MEHLQLKHLAPYLPYGLQVQLDGKYLLISLGSDTGLIKYKNHQRYEPINRLKPVLRPLSNLTKGFYINDEEITPCDYFEEQHDYAKIQFQLENMSNHNYCDGWLPYFVQQKLIEWHFDVFGLIPKGLAVDINI